MLIKKIKIGEIGTNCYIVKNSKRCFVIDPADEVDEIFRKIGRLNLEFILLTHGHFDHVLAVEDIHKKYPNIPVYIGKFDKELLRNLSEQKYYSTKELKDLSLSVRIVSDGDRIKFGDNKIKVIETPGHSFGSVCYLLGNHLFSGDTLFYHTIGRTDFWTSDPSSMQQSLKKLSKLPTKTKIYPGHGRSTTIAEEIQNGHLI